MGNTGNMTRINAVLYYEIGAAVHPLTDLKCWTIIEPFHLKILFYAAEKLEKLINLDMGDNSKKFAKILLDEIERIINKYVESMDKTKKYAFYDIVTAAQNFENEFKIELLNREIRELIPENGFDIKSILHNPKVLFHEDLLKFCPYPYYDLAEIGKALAFKRPIEAAFYLLRLTKIVASYYLVFLNNSEVSMSLGNLTLHIDALQKDEKADKKIINSLQNIYSNYEKNMEVDGYLVTEEEAIALYGIVKSAVNYIVETIKKGQETTN